MLLADDRPEDVLLSDAVVDVPELVTADVVVDVSSLVGAATARLDRWWCQWWPEDVPPPDVAVDVPELVVAGGSFTVMVWAALVIGVPVESVAATVSVAVG